MFRKNVEKQRMIGPLIRDIPVKKTTNGFARKLAELRGDVVVENQPRSQGLSSLPPGGREERPWERGWSKIT